MEIDMGEEKVNIKKYYNDQYVKVVRDLIMNAHQPVERHNQPHSAHHPNPNPILMSPLKDILPREVQKNNLRNHHKEGNAQKDLLLAYTDSPLLRHQPITFKGNKEMKACTILDYNNFEPSKATEQQENQRTTPTAVSEQPKKSKHFVTQSTSKATCPGSSRACPVR